MKRIFALISVICLLFSLSACTNSSGNNTPEPQDTGEPQKALMPVTETVPLRVKMHYNNDIPLFYPYAVGIAKADSINAVIFESFTSVLSECNVIDFDYVEAYNDNGILSLLFKYGVRGEAIVRTEALNFDCTYGNLLTLSSFLGDNTAEWNELLCDSVEEYATKSNIVLWQTEKLIFDNQMFYISEDGIVLLYGIYEIAGYDNGAILVTIPYSDIYKHLNNTEFGLAILKKD